VETEDGRGGPAGRRRGARINNLAGILTFAQLMKRHRLAYHDLESLQPIEESAALQAHRGELLQFSRRSHESTSGPSRPQPLWRSAFLFRAQLKKSPTRPWT
jgi:hypothetical protein